MNLHPWVSLYLRMKPRFSNGVLARECTALKRHHEHGNSYEGKTFHQGDLFTAQQLRPLSS